MSATAARAAIDALLRFNPQQPRDSKGRWTDGSGGAVTAQHLMPFDFDVQAGLMESLYEGKPYPVSAINAPSDPAAVVSPGRRSILLRVKAAPGQASAGEGGRVQLPAGSVRATESAWVDNPDGSRTWVVDAVYEGPDGNDEAAPELPPATMADFDAAAAGQDAWAAVRPSGSRTSDAATTYSGNSFREVNGFLRAGGRGYEYTGMRDDIAALTEGIDRNRLDRPVIVWRGVGNGHAMLGDAYNRSDLTGLEWQDDAFVSTTADEEVLSREHFIHRGGGAVKMRMLLPEGTGAIRVGPWNYEAELLLNRGNRFRVIRDRGMVDGVRQLDVEVLPRVGTDR